ncbi:MAG TPA: cyclase family protein, partial [Actinomycetota bacterium]|nr:cyclase family protein [Actinomycetota bacterium]
MARIIDLGHAIYDGMPAYPGLPPARVTQFLSHEGSRERYDHRAEFALTLLEIAGNTGTYLDSPWHRHSGAYDIAGIPLDRVADLPGFVVDGVDGAQGGASEVHFDSDTVRGGALLIRTGWSDRWSSEDYWTKGPCLATRTIDKIVQARPSLVGVDFSNVDDIRDPERPVHTQLLGADILIVEHLTGLSGLPREGFRFHCVPLSVGGAASIPVRPYAVVEERSMKGTRRHIRRRP